MSYAKMTTRNLLSMLVSRDERRRQWESFNLHGYNDNLDAHVVECVADELADRIDRGYAGRP